MAWLDFLLGRPLASGEEKSERLGTLSGVPIFGLDALGSAAYGPEAALTLLLPLGVGGIHNIVPITITIIALLGVVYFSYRQTIAAYPQGGSSYVVARQNLGKFAGLLAGTALMVDFVLVVAVGVAAGIGALVSAVPGLQTHTLLLSLVVLVLITFVNLRGIRTTGAVFMFPTYFFIVCLLVVLGIGLARMLLSGGHPTAIVPPPRPSTAAVQMAGAWLILRSFANGCTAMTGVEAVSTGITAFRDPRVKIARRTLSFIIGVLVAFLAGIAWICRAYEISATRPGQSGYQTVLSLVTAAVVGRNWFYYITIASILMVLVLQANTAFTGFPNVCRAIAQDGYLPYSFMSRGRRLVYSHGIYVLAFLSAALLIAFRGVTDRLIPLFAVGAFLAFTLSQAGMVAHWKRTGGAHARHSMIINGVGTIATALTVLVVIVSKFVEGAWITLVAIPGILLLMRAVRRHYDRVGRELSSPHPLPTSKLKPPIVAVPIEGWNKVTEKALRFALTLSPDIIALQVSTSDEPHDLETQWATLVEDPTREARLPVPRLQVLRSPYRAVVHPTVEYIHKLEREHPNREIAVVIPQLVERHWYEYFLHRRRGELLAALLLLEDEPRINIINVPWHLRT
ncbi:MAG: APC family permease [Acidobacteria bacterium]|nr:MAG: APC family permease [Acidobacteriota bacterium]PYV67813.1 MAG: APC family permease [Acidobacteriota bacterium]